MGESELIWKEIIGYPNYSISSNGKVKNNKTDRILKQWQCYGYSYIGLSSLNIYKRFRVHKIVALHFIGICPDGYQINHKDGNKHNNLYTNLEYVTASQNLIHAYNNGLRLIPTGSKHWSSKLTEEDANKIRVFYKEGYSNMKELSVEFGVSQPTISAVVNRKRWN